MLNSFGDSSSNDQEEEDHHQRHHQIQIQLLQPTPNAAHLHHRHHLTSLSPRSLASSPPIHMRQLLISCAELLSRADFPAAHRLIFILSSNSSADGDSTERLVHQFTKALSLRLNRTTSSFLNNVMIPTPSTASTSDIGSHDQHHHLRSSNNEALLQSSYLTLNQVTPFNRFSQLTANQAILEAIEGQRAIHILDFDITHGVQWPPLMQALADRYPPPTLRITATGKDTNTLRRTGDRLSKFAHSLGLRFQFHPLMLLSNEDPISVASSMLILPDETLVVNCVHYLHSLLEDRGRLHMFLHSIKAMNPKILTVAEREANHNHPVFLQRFVEALDHYAAVFDSLEATLPPNSRERLALEQIWFGREICDIVAAEGDSRRERHERFRSWEIMLRSSGFSSVPLSPFALSQAKLLLKLHYPSEGYRILHVHRDYFFLGWHNQALFSVSSWH